MCDEIALLCEILVNPMNGFIETLESKASTLGSKTTPTMEVFSRYFSRYLNLCVGFLVM